jgi:hypothetical protein
MLIVSVFGEQIFWRAGISRKLGADFIPPERLDDLDAGCT